MEKLEQPPSDPWVDALPLGFGAESVRQFIHIVERSKILLQFVKVRPKTARIVGVIDANQPELGLQPFLPSPPRVKILWNQFLDRPFAPLQRLAVGTPDGLANAARIDPGGQQSLQRVRFAREAYDHLAGRPRRGLADRVASDQESDGRQDWGVFLPGQLQEQFRMHL
jgi:hypothetical protein